MGILTSGSSSTRLPPWHPSPQPGVAHKLLDSTGDEAARATGIVLYAAGSALPEQDLGEEFLVLDGVFSDGNGSYPAGTYATRPVSCTTLPLQPVASYPSSIASSRTTSAGQSSTRIRRSGCRGLFRD